MGVHAAFTQVIEGYQNGSISLVGLILIFVLIIGFIIFMIYGRDIIHAIVKKIKENKTQTDTNNSTPISEKPATNNNAAPPNNTSETDNMQYCIYCGAKIPEGSQYCMKCGKQLPNRK